MYQNQNGGEQYHSFTEYRGPNSPTWLQKINENQNASTRIGHDYFTNIKKRLQAKEEEAWYKVKKQEE